ncbi:MAG: hypothetical protein LBV23_04400, partial [Deltaproteobacteria bacterium]|nr:hypothetical protein [Deltaproteobacteria bacterium]
MYKSHSLRFKVILLFLTLIWLSALLEERSIASEWPAPAAPPGVVVTQSLSLEERLESLIKLPFRPDGVVSDDGRWTTWAAPLNTIKTPGFNCSGYVLEAVRLLTWKDLTLEAAKYDIEGDSGPDSPLGADWDFGLDLIRNLTGGSDEVLIPQPQRENKIIVDASQRPLGWGVDVNGPEFEELLKSLRPDSYYLFAVSKPERRFKSGLSYYHVGLIHAASDGAIWVYQCTLRAKVHRINVAEKRGLTLLRRYFPPIKNSQRRIILARLNLDEKFEAALNRNYAQPVAKFDKSPDVSKAREDLTILLSEPFNHQTTAQLASLAFKIIPKLAQESSLDLSKSALESKKDLYSQSTLIANKPLAENHSQKGKSETKESDKTVSDLAKKIHRATELSIKKAQDLATKANLSEVKPR